MSDSLDNASEHLRWAILLSYYLGLRPGPVELLSLTWLAVNWETETIMMTSAHKGGPEKRVVPLHPDLIGPLKSWYESDKNKGGPIIHFRGRPVTDIRTAWRNALRRAGITRKLRLYDIRHAFATAVFGNHGIQSGNPHENLTACFKPSSQVKYRRFLVL
jgi:integrase